MQSYFKNVSQGLLETRQYTDPLAGLLSELNDQYLPKAGADDFWEDFPSIRRVYAFLVENNLIKQNRRFGRVKEETHFKEVTSRAVALGRYLDLPAEVIAFLAFTHDICEDNTKIEPEQLVSECWLGDEPVMDYPVLTWRQKFRAYARDLLGIDAKSREEWAPYLVAGVHLLTDQQELRPSKEKRATMTEEALEALKKKRLDSQVEIANAKPANRLKRKIRAAIALIRAQDKMATLFRDALTLFEGLMPFGTAVKFRAYFQPRHDVVRRMKALPPSVVAAYDRLVEAVENGISSLDASENCRQRDPIMERQGTAEAQKKCTSCPNQNLLFPGIRCVRSAAARRGVRPNQYTRDPISVTERLFKRLQKGALAMLAL